MRLNANTARDALERAISNLAPYPGGKSGRGIVVCAGGEKYFPCAWVGLRLLRQHGCRLPVQFWHLGPDEAQPWMKQATRPFGVEWIDARELARSYPARILNGWELKPYSILHSPFREVLFLDADNLTVRDPTYLFEAPEFQRTGAAFWPDFGRLAPNAAIWRLTGLAYRDEPEFESGQVLVDKTRVWRELALAMWFNEHSDFWYQHFLGDKETFHLAWRKLGTPYAMPAHRIHHVGGHTMCQHDFSGQRVFQHRNLDKWTLDGSNRRDADFLFERECRAALVELRALRAGTAAHATVERMRELSQCLWYYERVGYDGRLLELLGDGLIGRGADRCEQTWTLDASGDLLTLRGDRPTCELRREAARWRGRWLSHEQMAASLTPYQIRGSRDRAWFHEVWQADSYGLRALRRTVELRSAAVVGAGVGAVSAWLQRLWPALRLLAIEADSSKLPLLRANVAHFPAAVVLHAVVATAEGPSPATALGAGEAPRASLPELLQSQGFADPDYLHVDCGAHTAAIVQHASQRGRLAAIPLIAGECTQPDARRRLHDALAGTHDVLAPEGVDGLGTFLARRR